MKKNVYISLLLVISILLASVPCVWAEGDAFDILCDSLDRDSGHQSQRGILNEELTLLAMGFDMDNNQILLSFGVKGASQWRYAMYNDLEPAAAWEIFDYFYHSWWVWLNLLNTNYNAKSEGRISVIFEDEQTDRHLGLTETIEPEEDALYQFVKGIMDQRMGINEPENEEKTLQQQIKDLLTSPESQQSNNFSELKDLLIADHPSQENDNNIIVPNDPTIHSTAKPSANQTATVRCTACDGNGRVTERCSSCRGSGDLKCSSCSGNGYYRCSSCGGDGVYQCSACRGSGRRADNSRCSSCSGSGDKRCSNCSGNGEKRCNVCSGRGEKDCHYCSGKGSETSQCSRCGGDGEL